MRSFQSPDGKAWTVEIRSPGASNAMVLFRHPNQRTGRLDRYAWHLWHGAEAHDVTARLRPAQVMEAISDADLARLFRRSMPVAAERGLVNRSV